MKKTTTVTVKLLQNTNNVSQLALVMTEYKLQALADDILPLEEGAGKQCSECGLNVVASLTKGHRRKGAGEGGGGTFFSLFFRVYLYTLVKSRISCGKFGLIRCCETWMSRELHYPT